MRIGIDIQTTLGEKTGFGFYVKNLTENLLKIDGNNQYSFFRPKRECDLSAPQRFYWDQFQIPRLAKKNKVEILHQPSFSVPIFYHGKVIVTVHDLIARLFGKDIPFFSRQFFGKWMPFSYRFTDKIIAISECTKNDIIKLLGVPEEKIKVIHLAAGKEFTRIFDNDEIKRVKDKYKTGKKYLLHIGTLNPRKNLEFLIKVYKEIIADFPEYNLVITGKKGWYYEGLFKLVKKFGLEKKVIFTGYIEDKDAPYLYNGATIFLFPSLYEGFGLPPLEAMACGCPVISSNTSSLPEVIATAGVLLSPKDIKSWVRNIKMILAKKNIRLEMSKKSILQARKFSWEKCAKETLEVYERLMKEVK